MQYRELRRRFESSFKIYSSTQEAQTTCMLNNQVKSVLDSNGFSKIMCPFGILVFSDDGYSDDVSSSNSFASLECLLIPTFSLFYHYDHSG